MRITIAILFLCITVTNAVAQKVYIDRPDGQIVLGQADCQSGGREATFIESRDNGGGAYGCWELVGNQVKVHWNTGVGQNGSIIRMDSSMIFTAPASMLPSDTPAESQLKRLAVSSAARCYLDDQGCIDYQKYLAQLETRNWCLSKAGAWVRCR